MTQDQILFRLCEAKRLKGPVGSRVDTATAVTAMASLKKDKDGLVAGVSADGKPMRAKIAGKSLARRLMEEEAERKRAEREARPKQQRTKRGKRRTDG